MEVKKVRSANTPKIKKPLRCLLTIYSNSEEIDLLLDLEYFISGKITAIDSDNIKHINTSVDPIALSQLNVYLF